MLLYAHHITIVVPIYKNVYTYKDYKDEGQLKYVAVKVHLCRFASKHARKFSQIGFEEQGQYVKNENKEIRSHPYIFHPKYMRNIEQYITTKTVLI